MDEFYNATTEEALKIIEESFRHLQSRGVKSNYGVTSAAIRQIRINEGKKNVKETKPEAGSLSQLT